MSDTEILVSMPDCTATQVLGDTSVELGRGTLMLMQSIAIGVQDPSPAPLTLTLTIGQQIAFPLYPSTTFGTLASDPRSYVFTPSLEKGSGGAAIGGGQGGYVRIRLPEGILEEGSELARSQEAFEKALIGIGVLKERAYSAAELGDEIGKGVRGGAESIGQSVRVFTDDHISSADSPAQSSSATFSPTTHTFIDSVTSTTQSAADWTSSARQAVTSAAERAGEHIGQKSVDLSVVEMPKRDSLQLDGANEGAQELYEFSSNTSPTIDLDDYATGISNVTSGLSSGTSTLSTSLSTATRSAAQSEFGEEVSSVGSDAVKAAGNVGKTVGNVVGIGGVGEVYGGVKGVVKGVRGEVERLEEVELGK